MYTHPDSEHWYVIDAVNEIDSPALIIYKDRVQQNIELLKKQVDDLQRLRPHVKTHKSREAAELLLHAGLKKFKCATIAEAEMLAVLQAPDVLLAYQPIGPKAQRFISLMKTYPETRFSCLVDNRDAAHSLSEQAVQAQLKIRVLIDLNVGMNRTGILPDDSALALYIFCATLPGLAPIGWHVYDGHITDTDFALRTEKCNSAFAPVEWLCKALVEKGFAAPVVVAGGSATFPIHAKRSGIECSPGTFIYWDAGYGHLLPEQPFLPAALALTRIISLPTNTMLCTDLGHKSVASENVLNKRVRFVNAPELTIVSQSEEHLVLEAGTNHTYRIGDVLYGLPYHICPTCALYERAVVVEGRKPAAEWRIIARDRKLST